MKYFSDIHFHVMTMQEPNFASFINSFYSSPQDLLVANATDNYLLTPKMLKGDNLLNTITNTLTAFDRPIGDTFRMMEDDLRGRFSSPKKASYAPPQPYIRDNKLYFRGEEYDKLIMVPLLMDFSQNQSELNKIYYTFEAKDKITPYAEATIEGMKRYYDMNPDGMFEFYPFIGINPKLHSFDFLEKLLSTYVNTSHKMHKDHTVPRKPFYGIKIYPPLDFNPWPKDEELLEKTRYLYAWCEENEIPIITHCDDQGFRGIPAQLAWSYTDPATWRTVLENYPQLKIDFAHFGKQYAATVAVDIKSIQAKHKKYPSSPWFRSIIELMTEFPNVYADLSFTGTDPTFYSNLTTFLSSLPDQERETIEGRILFGSDFSVNLFKVESYTEYYSILDHSVISNELIDRIASRNMLPFIGLEE